MENLVIRFIKDVSPTYALVLNIPVEYKSADKFILDFYKWCTEVSGSEFGFKDLGLQPSHGPTLEVLTLEEWFWKYKKTIAL